MKVAGGVGESTDGTPPFAIRLQRMGHPVVVAEMVVRVVRIEDNLRLEMAGVAQGSGGVGDAVRVRVGAAGEERFVEGVIRGEGLVELGAGL